MKSILVLNGPNLGMLGAREPEVYGDLNLEHLKKQIADWATADQHVEVRQTDSESMMIEWVHEAFNNKTDVIINPAAFTHYSYALRDAVAMLEGVVKVVEVHISNPHRREKFRHTSVISSVANGVIAGFGLESYRLALNALT
ncbi:MAG TPA: type II 3-dehydroquinate dehydratase [Microbacteriaceae bacterium]|nr:type II 3-dehydroquinate dehydratase [Microbacteriaceae bacterium]